MSDVVVTVPLRVWFEWLEEGDSAGDPPSGEEWGFYLGGSRPIIGVGERVYVVSHGRLRGYSPLTRLAKTQFGWALVRKAGAVAVTVPENITGFRGWKTRWWDRDIEVPFPAWRTEGVVGSTRAEREQLTALLRKYPAVPPPESEVLCEDLFERLVTEDPYRLISLLQPGALPSHLLTYAAEIAGSKLPAQRVVPPLLVLLDSTFSVVREGAIYGLAHHIADARVWKAIKWMASEDPSPGVRTAAQGAVAAKEDEPFT